MMFKPSGNPKVLELTKSTTNRSACLDRLQPIKREELNSLGKQSRLCAWCATEELFHGNRKYCEEECRRSATAFCYPQKEEGLRYLLLRQDWKCLGCQFDYRPFMEAVLRKDQEFYKVSLKIETAPWYYYKRLKNKVPDNRNPEVDHVIPISKGGESLGISNHQILCKSCHLSKTRLDLSGKRPKKT